MEDFFRSAEGFLLYIKDSGGMAEWLKAAVLKTAER